MPSKPIIRDIGATDVPHAATLMEAMWRQHSEEAWLIDPTKIMISAADYIEKLIENEKTPVLIAAIGERVVGVMSCEIRDLPRYYRYEQELYLDDLCVQQDMRGQGIAGLLIEAAEKLASARSIHVLTGKIWSFNIPSQSVFKKQHFTNDYSYWHKQI